MQREEAITEVGKECTASGKVGLVTGHNMFWPEDDEASSWVFTSADLATYTHIIYLDTPEEIIAKRFQGDTYRDLSKWLREERQRLRKACRDHGILFSMLRYATRGPGSVLGHILKLILDFKDHTEDGNLLRAQARLDEIVGSSDLETIMVIDGDRTLAAERQHLGAVVITCGLGLIWKKVLEKAGLKEKVKAIGGGHLESGFVVTAAVKGALVTRLREHNLMCVCAFGDNLRDLEMLCTANEAIVVASEEQTRSKTMDAEFTEAINLGGLKARQMLVSEAVPPRLNLSKLPKIRLAEIKARLRFPFLVHATEKGAAKLLMTRTRDQNILGPALQTAHRHVGRYLATEFLTEMIGLYEYPVAQAREGKDANGHRIFHENQTLIVALMRGGLCMAEGVQETFPRAGILHANVPDDITAKDLARQETLVLVDSVINEGTTVARFIEHIRELDTAIRIVVVAGVVQEEAVRQRSPLRKLALKQGQLNVVTLRLWDNKYLDAPAIDTGDRLFNTRH